VSRSDRVGDFRFKGVQSKAVPCFRCLPLVVAAQDRFRVALLNDRRMSMSKCGLGFFCVTAIKARVADGRAGRTVFCWRSLRSGVGPEIAYQTPKSVFCRLDPIAVMMLGFMSSATVLTTGTATELPNCRYA
jgi:hypothetical protein